MFGRSKARSLLVLSIILRIGIRESSLIYSLYLVPDHGARERYSLSTNVNRPLFQVHPLQIVPSHLCLGTKCGEPAWATFTRGAGARYSLTSDKAKYKVNKVWTQHGYFMKSRDKTRPKLYRDLLIKLASFLRLSTRDRQERFESFAVRCIFFSVVYSKITKQFVFRFQDNLSWGHDEILCLIDIKADWLKLITLRATLVYQNPILINKEMQKRWVNRWEKEVWCLICDRTSSMSSAPTASIAHTRFKKKTIAQISFSQTLALGDSWFHFGRVANIMDYVFLSP